MRNSLLIGFILLTSLRYTLAQAGNSHVVYSPDRQYAVVWTDVQRGEQEPAARIISILDVTNLEMLFTRLTTQRYTSAEWNALSSRLALFDAPDNANTTLWIFSQERGAWSREQIDAMATIEKCLSKSELLKNPKGGINEMHWESADILGCEIQAGHTLFSLRVNVRESPISTQVKRLTNENGQP